MKKFNVFLTLGMVLLIAGILFSGCKKKEDPIIPAFTVSSITVIDQNTGIAYLQFSAKCTNDDVKMTKVTIYDPLSNSETYNTNGIIVVKNQQFDLQDANTGYLKRSGNWTFNFVGNRTADGASFSESTTLAVSGK